MNRTTLSSIKKTSSSFKELPSVKLELLEALETTNKKFEAIKNRSYPDHPLSRTTSFFNLFENELLILKSSLLELLLLSNVQNRKMIDSEEVGILVILYDLLSQEDLNAILAKQMIGYKSVIADTKIDLKKSQSSYNELKAILIELYRYLKLTIKYYLNKKMNKESIVLILQKRQSSSLSRMAINPLYIKIDNLLKIINIIFDKFKLKFNRRQMSGGRRLIMKK